MRLFLAKRGWMVCRRLAAPKPAFISLNYPITSFMGLSSPAHLPMPHDNIVPTGRQLMAAGVRSVPSLFVDAGEKAWWRFVEFFTAHIRNRNTREAYAR